MLADTPNLSLQCPSRPCLRQVASGPANRLLWRSIRRNGTHQDSGRFAHSPLARGSRSVAEPRSQNPESVANHPSIERAGT
jgi:hypothetical protein